MELAKVQQELKIISLHPFLLSPFSCFEPWREPRGIGIMGWEDVGAKKNERTITVGRKA
jgi:hypothetical protein